ncbi:hypothetical protein [Amycolatopsis albispora]|nr:hypothetical protein [Amycolatopsis albispora]
MSTIRCQGLDGTHIGRWNLERTLADVEADATGRALFATVRRADERG